MIWPVTYGASRTRNSTARGDVLGLARALERRLPDDPGAQLVRHAVAFGPQDCARGHAVHAHVGAEILRERAREHREAGLRGAIHGVIAQRPLRVHVDDVDDDALRRAQRRQQRLGEEQRRLQIAADEIVPLLLGDGTEQASDRNSTRC